MELKLAIILPEVSAARMVKSSVCDDTFGDMYMREGVASSRMPIHIYK